MYKIPPHAGMARKTSLLFELNIDVRFLIYDCIVEQNRFIQIQLREEEHADSRGSGDEEEDRDQEAEGGHEEAQVQSAERSQERDGDQEANVDSLASLSNTHPELKMEISRYILLYNLQRSPRYGFFDPKNTVFSLDLRNTLQVKLDVNEIVTKLYVVPVFKAFMNVEPHAQHVRHVSFDLRFPTSDAEWANPVKILQENSLMVECSHLKQLCSVELVITEDMVARWKQDERALEIKKGEHEGREDGIMEWMLWTLFWANLRRTCPPSAVCTCCVLPDFKLRVVGERLGQERMILMPNFTYQPDNNIAHRWYGLVGGQSSRRQAAIINAEIGAFKVFRIALSMAETA
jgi:hypothetical protein